MSDLEISLRKFFIKLFHWEYWPFGILQLPAIIYYFWLSFRARTFLFFSASNPGIDMGGMFGESKYDVIAKIPSEYTPKTILIKIPATLEQTLAALHKNNFSFPVIFKPDIGERGYRVKKINSNAEISEYIAGAPYDFLIQELVDLPVELGVFYFRHPGEMNGKVTSIVMKEMLFVIGDGKSTLQQLILGNDRALLQWKKLCVTFQTQLNEIVKAGKSIELVSVGNHALGTKFLNGNHLINPELNNVFDTISKQIGGFYFGRFDIRCRSLTDLYNGNVTILELNGCGAEPAHIYDPNFRFIDAVIVLIKHWRTIFEIARENKKLGVDYIRLSEARVFYKRFKTAIR